MNRSKRVDQKETRGYASRGVKRLLTLVASLAVLGLGVDLGVMTSSGSTNVPVLGAVWAPNQRGWGTQRPTEIYGGGAPEGLVASVRWTNWGRAIATGAGIGFADVPGHQTAGRMHAVVLAWNLGDCQGMYSYRSVAWYFPSIQSKIRTSSKSVTAKNNICKLSIAYNSAVDK